MDDNVRPDRWLQRLSRTLIFLAAIAPLAGYAALRGGRGATAALALAALQLAVVGVGIGALNGLRRWALLPLPAAMLAAGVFAASRSPTAGIEASAGIAHAVAYAGLLLRFGASLLPGRTELVTDIARRTNPRFHAGMRGYTRGVTWAWCVLFAAELAISAGLLRFAPAAWLAFVHLGHLLPVVLLGLAEYTWRRYRIGAQGTSLVTTMRALRRRGSTPDA